MRKRLNINNDWYFNKGYSSFSPNWEKVNVPHTWNRYDGYSGGNNYYRGICTYYKKLGKLTLDNSKVFLEFKGVSLSCIVVFNGVNLGEHKGGYSTFRYDITEYLNDENEIYVYVNNSDKVDIYPSKADFTFYGGIYRDVNIVVTDKTHFELLHYGGEGIKITPNNSGDIDIQAYVTNGENELVKFEILDRDNKKVSSGVANVKDGVANLKLHCDNVHLWNGKYDPYLYTLVSSVGHDQIETKFGFRTFEVDPKEGFRLNGKPYDLIGCSRHQDREGYGVALTKEMHKEDMDIIKEMGASTIRLAHYQHDDYIYSLCDEYGIIVWAEIPYITEHKTSANENTKTQMKELIIQNYNHPSIMCWGLSNEITVVGGESEDCIKNHKELNDLCHSLDSSRYTTMANLFMLEPTSPLIQIPDLRSYNLYYGWYVGEMDDNDKWFDDFHQKYSNVAIGLSEYGCDANPKYQTSKPVKGDYTETYQALYHEHMLKMRMKRPWIWSMHCWNMFDFAADARDEGGKKGQNQKGLVTFDRKIKKDAFYVYKAYLSDEPFIHISGKRYVDRCEDITEVKIYSNQKEVSIYVDDKLFETQKGEHVFTFNIPISGKHVIKAKSGELCDETIINKSEKVNEEYICPSKMDVSNWFDDIKETNTKYFSIYDKVKDIKNHPIAGMVYKKMMEEALKSFGDVAKNVQIPKEMQEKMDNMTLEENLKMAGHMVKPDMVKALNDILQKIKK